MKKLVSEDFLNFRNKYSVCEKVVQKCYRKFLQYLFVVCGECLYSTIRIMNVHAELLTSPEASLLLN